MSDEDTVRGGDHVDGELVGSAFLPPEGEVAAEVAPEAEVPAEETPADAPSDDVPADAPVADVPADPQAEEEEALG